MEHSGTHKGDHSCRYELTPLASKPLHEKTGATFKEKNLLFF